MGSGNFFSGLLGGYAGTLVKNEERQYTQELAAKELRIHSSLKALEAAMNSGDKNAMGLASQNLDEAISSLQDIGKKKPKQKKESPHGGLLQSIIGAIGGGQGQQAPPNLPPMPGVSQGAGGMPRDPGMSTGPSAPQTALPAMPKPVALGDVLSAIPGPEQQAETTGKSQAAETGARFEALKAQEEKNLGRPLKQDEANELWERISGILPKNISTKPTLVTKNPIKLSDAAKMMPNAVLPDGRPISALVDEDGERMVTAWQFPDRTVVFPASGTTASAETASAMKAQRIKELMAEVNPDTGKDYTYEEAAAKVSPRAPSFAEKEANAWIAAHPGKTLADYIVWSKTVASQPSVPLSPEAQDMMARLYLQTGQTPSIGWGKAGVDAKIKIINRAGKMGQGTDVAENRAVYDSLKASLAKTQVQARMLNAFENVANKNLDLLLDTSKKLVDTGSPWINSTIRYLGQHATGSTDVTKFVTARQVAINEVSRVLNNMGSNGVLSDAARGEVAILLSPDSTIAQINAAAKILKQDMKNRHEGFPAEIRTIQENIRNIGKITPSGGRKTGSTATPSAAPSGTENDPLGVY